MGKDRLLAFSDGVLAIVITIMVLELKVPRGPDLEALWPLLPVFLGYVLSFVYVGIYWNNHHHMFYACKKVSGTVLWANLHLLFWLSLLPFVTGWMGANPLATVPTALYGSILLMAALAYWLLQKAIIGAGAENALLRLAVGRDWKGNASLLIYAAAIGVSTRWPRVSQTCYVAVALLWVIPDRRIERVLETGDH